MAQENTIEPSPELKTADKACDDLSWGFLDKPPTTVAGVAALLTYAEEHLAAGYRWPDNRAYYDDGEDVDWQRGLMKTMGLTLQRLAAQSWADCPS